RFIDTAGIRETVDVIEGLGFQKTYQKIEQAQVVIYLFDADKFQVSGSKFQVEIETIKNKYPLKNLVIVANKVDKLSEEEINNLQSAIFNLQLLSAKTNQGVEELQNKLLHFVNTGAL